MLVNILIFLRIGILYAPALYLGPSGADRVFYYAYARSLVIDRDLDFRNEIALKPPSSGLVLVDGKPHNKYPVGSPLLSLPAYTLTHLVLSGLHHLGVEVPPTDGYSQPYVFAYALSQLAWATLGYWLLFLIVCDFFDPMTSALAMLGATFGTGLLRYTSFDLMMSHAASFFSLMWCLHEAIKLRADPAHRARWLLLGAACALTIMTRLQNGLFLIIPAIAILQTARRMYSQRKTTGFVVGILQLLVGFAVSFAPQVWVWKSTMNSLIANGYSAEMSFAWLSPELIGVGWLLLKWMPVLTLGIGGCLVLAYRRHDPILLGLVLTTIGSIYVTAAWWAWAIAPRTTFDNPATVSLGLAATFQASAGIARWLPWLIVALLLVWNIPFVVDNFDGGPVELLAAWFRSFSVLLRLAS